MFSLVSLALPSSTSPVFLPSAALTSPGTDLVEKGYQYLVSRFFHVQGQILTVINATVAHVMSGLSGFHSDSQVLFCQVFFHNLVFFFLYSGSAVTFCCSLK